MEMTESPLYINHNQYLDLLKLALTAACYDESAWVLVRSDRRTVSGWFGRQFVRFLAKKNLGLVRKRKFDWEVRRNGQDWPLFAYTMVGLKRLENVQFCIENVIRDGVPGELVEAGCWRGGVGIFMKAVLRAHEEREWRVFLADTFEGMPQPKSSDDGADISNLSYLEASLEDVKRNFERFALLDDDVCFLKGLFENTLPEAPIERIAVLRADGDLYHSTMDVLTNLYPKVQKGGYVIIDDYFSWKPCRQAVTDYLEKQDLQPEIMRIDNDAAYWRVH